MEADTERGKQRERERKRQRERERHIHTHRQGKRGRCRERQADRERERHIHTHRQGKRGRCRERQADRERERRRHRDRGRESNRETDRQRQTERDIRKSGETGLVDGDGLAGGVQLHPGRVFRCVLHDTDIACGAQTNKNTLNIGYIYTTLHLSRQASYQKKQLQPQRLFCTLKCLQWVYPSVAHTGRFTPGLQVSRRVGGMGTGGGGGDGRQICAFCDRQSSNACRM